MDRRKRYYIDKKFQKRFLILFVAIAFIVAFANIFFYGFVISTEIERMIYKSHFLYDNLYAYFETEFFKFSIYISLFVIVVTVSVYSFFRVRIKVFFEKFSRLIDILIKNPEDAKSIVEEIPEEFEGISFSLNSLLNTILSNRKKQEELFEKAEKYLKN